MKELPLTADGYAVVSSYDGHSLSVGSATVAGMKSNARKDGQERQQRRRHTCGQAGGAVDLMFAQRLHCHLPLRRTGRIKTTLRTSPVPRRHPGTIGVTSYVCGVGKTTVACLLGYSLAQQTGKRVLLIDADPACSMSLAYGFTPGTIDRPQLTVYDLCRPAGRARGACVDFDKYALRPKAALAPKNIRVVCGNFHLNRLSGDIGELCECNGNKRVGQLHRHCAKMFNFSVMWSTMRAGQTAQGAARPAPVSWLSTMRRPAFSSPVIPWRSKCWAFRLNWAQYRASIPSPRSSAWPIRNAHSRASSTVRHDNRPLTTSWLLLRP